MAKTVFTSTKNRVLDGANPAFNWTGWTIRASLLLSTYTVSAAHADTTSIAAYISDTVVVGTKSVSTFALFGVLPAFTGLADGPVCSGVVFYRYTGTAANDYLLWWDPDLTLFPLQTVGVPIQLTWPSNKLFQLS